METKQSAEAAQAEQPQGPRVSVIVHSFHRGPELERCLRAIERSHGRDRLQVIVVDAGAHDTTPAGDLDHPDVTFLRMPRNFGATKGLNIGIRTAKTELILFVDPGIELQPDTVQVLADAMEASEGGGGLCPLLEDAAGNPVPQTRPLPDREMLWRFWQGEPMPGFPASPGQVLEYPDLKAILVKLSFLKGMNYFDEGYGEWGADAELAFQIHHSGKRILVVEGAKAIDHSATDPQPRWTNAQRALLAADRLQGAAHYIGKRSGFVAGLRFRLAAILVTFGRAITFQGGGYNWGLLSALLGGRKVDGSQSEL